MFVLNSLRSSLTFTHALQSGRDITLVLDEHDPPPPAWFERVFHKVAGLLDLAPNWDSYGASIIDSSLLQPTFEILLHELPTSLAEPLVNPTSGGGINFEWHRRGANAEVELVPDDETTIVAVYVEENGVEREERGVLSTTRPLLGEVARIFGAAS